MSEMALRVAEAIMRRVDDFKIVQVNGHDSPRLKELLMEATQEVLAAMPSPTDEIARLRGEVQRLRVAYKLNVGIWPPDAPTSPIYAIERWFRVDEDRGLVEMVPQPPKPSP